MICEICNIQPGVEVHHKFSKSKWAINLYPEYIHDRRNLMNICYDCHHAKSLVKWSEDEFCEAMEIVPRGKILKFRRGNE